jgi:Uma2 family endonuclease
MATAPARISESKYLRTTYRPDCDYVDGAVLERNLGQHDHARLQTLILFLLMQHEKDSGIYLLVEQRLKIRPGKYRVPDVMVLSADAPQPKLHRLPVFGHRF